MALRSWYLDCLRSIPLNFRMQQEQAKQAKPALAGKRLCRSATCEGTGASLSEQAERPHQAEREERERMSCLTKKIKSAYTLFIRQGYYQE